MAVLQKGNGEKQTSVQPTVQGTRSEVVVSPSSRLQGGTVDPDYPGVPTTEEKPRRINSVQRTNNQHSMLNANSLERNYCSLKVIIINIFSIFRGKSWAIVGSKSSAKPADPDNLGGQCDTLGE